MKKIFTLFAVLFAGLALNANEALLKQTVMDYHKAQASLDGVKSLTYIHKNYQATSAKGEKIDYVKVQQICKAMPLLVKLTGPNWTVTDFMEINALMQGKELTAAERQQAEALNNNPQVKQQIAAAIPQVKLMISQMQQQMQASLKTLTIDSIKVNGSKAVVVYTMKALESDKLEQTTADWVKVNGKWMVIKEVEKYLN